MISLPCALLAQVFEAAPQEVRGAQAKKASVEYFLVSAANVCLCMCKGCIIAFQIVREFSICRFQRTLPRMGPAMHLFCSVLHLVSPC